MGRLAAFELNLISSFVKIKDSSFFKFSKFMYLCGIEPDFSLLRNSNLFFIIFQGSFFDTFEIKLLFNLILPVGIYTESQATYLNLEGRIRMTKQATVSIFNLLND